MTASPMGRPPIDPTQQKYQNGREILENFQTTAPKEKSYLEWLLFLDKFLPRGSKAYQKWRARFLVAQWLDLFGKGTGVQPGALATAAGNEEILALLNRVAGRVRRGPTVEEAFYREFIAEAIPAFFEHVGETIDDQYMRAGLMSMDSKITMPDSMRRSQAHGTEG